MLGVLVLVGVIVLVLLVALALAFAPGSSTRDESGRSSNNFIDWLL